MGVSENKLPVFRAILPAEIKKYKFATKLPVITFEVITEFSEKIKADNLAPVLGSEKLGFNNGLLTVIKAKNYD